MVSPWKVCIILVAGTGFKKVSGYGDNMYFRLTNDTSGLIFGPGAHSEVVLAESNSQCAAICITKACVIYSFVDKVCTLEGVGNATDIVLGQGLHTFTKNTGNRARGRPTYGFHVIYSSSGPKKAVDEFTCLEWSRSYRKCCFVTYQTTKSWLVIDLEAVVKVNVIAVGGKIFKGVEVRVGQTLVTTKDKSSYELFGSHDEIVNGNYIIFTHRRGIEGRFISVQQMGYANIFVCNVIVFGTN